MESLDEKDYTGSIIDEIKSEITDSVALIADLTGNRGGVYYESTVWNHQSIFLIFLFQSLFYLPDYLSYLVT